MANKEPILGIGLRAIQSHVAPIDFGAIDKEIARTIWQWLEITDDDPGFALAIEISEIAIASSSDRTIDIYTQREIEWQHDY